MEYFVSILLILIVTTTSIWTNEIIPKDNFTTPQTNQKSILIPDYDNVEHNLKIFDQRTNKSLILQCNITINDKLYNLAWGKNGKDVSLDPDLIGRYHIDNSANKFIIDKPNDNDAGLYTCSIPEINDSKLFNVVAMVYINTELPATTAVVEGEKLSIHCKVNGTNPEIKWTLGNDSYTESTGRIMLKDDHQGVKNAILVIMQTTLDDQGIVNCTATNVAVKYGNMEIYQEAETFTNVQIKDKLAALWPFIGICTEVFVLCAIILIYEKKRHRSAMDDSDDEQDKLKQVKK